MKHKKGRKLLIITATMLSMSTAVCTTVYAKKEEKVLNFGCAMYTDGMVNRASEIPVGTQCDTEFQKLCLNLTTIWKSLHGLPKAMK